MAKRFVSLVLVLLLFLSLFTMPVSADASTSVMAVGWSKNGTLTIYTAPNINEGAIWEIPEGEAFLITGVSESRAYYMILFQGVNGFVDANQVRYSQEEVEDSFHNAGDPWINRQNTRVYSQADPESEILDTLDYGTEVRILASSFRYMKIQAGDLEGYVHSSFLSYTDNGYMNYDDVTPADLGGTLTSGRDLFEYFVDHGFTEEGAAGMLGNIYAESGLYSGIAEHKKIKELGVTSEEYTRGVDDGTYARDQFINDGVGYGLCQWTSVTRKGDLYDYAKSKGVSISNQKMQLEFICRELEKRFPETEKVLMSSGDIQETTFVFMINYEGGDNIYSGMAKRVHLSYSLAFYEEYRYKEPIDPVVALMEQYGIVTVTAPVGRGNENRIIMHSYHFEY